MARYLGGPCDGQDVGANFNANLVCGGVAYKRGADGNYRPDTGASGVVGVAALGTHAPKGWADLQRSVNSRLPTSLARSRQLRRAALRTLARRRRLG